jgi:amino acid adenylation domain-containing protein
MVLESAVAAPDRTLAALPLVSGGEREALTAEWATGARSFYPASETIASLFAGQAAAAPAAIALESADGQLTYGELDRRAAHLAARLSRAGAAPDSPVGVLLERSTDLIVALVAVVKAGAAYLPLDPQDPAERLRRILADSGTRVLLTHASLALDVADSGVATVAIDGDDNAEASPPPIPDVGPDHLACVMYTSGSTGTPKGVGVTHRNVVRLIRGTDYIRFGPDRVFLQLAPAAFDASTFEIWGALLNGARLAIAPPGLLTPEELGGVLRRHRVTTLWLTAGFFHLVVDENLAALECLDELIVGGDVVSLPHVRRLLRELPGCRIVNGYGPTETTTFATCHQVREAGGSAPTVAIGRPIANVQVYVLDRYLEPVPVGVPGELFIGGDGVTRGYLRRPGQTAERYLPDPFAVTPGRRLYRTGDRVRWRTGGVLEFLGRLDRQLKVRGFRVEPEEVEAVLAGHSGVQACAVDVVDDARGDRRLVAYVAADDSVAGTYELRSFLRERLPDYLVPASFIRVDRLPLTASGKIDRAALPRPKDMTADSETPFVAPRTPTEALLAALWAELLDAPRVGVHHNFFALGGHSLLATQVVSRIRRAFGVDLPLRALFELPTIAELAERLELVRREAPSAQLPLVRLPRDAYRLEDSPRGGPAGGPWPPSSDRQP